MPTLYSAIFSNKIEVETTDVIQTILSFSMYYFLPLCCMKMIKVGINKRNLITIEFRRGNKKAIKTYCRTFLYYVNNY